MHSSGKIVAYLGIAICSSDEGSFGVCLAQSDSLSGGEMTPMWLTEACRCWSLVIAFVFGVSSLFAFLSESCDSSARFLSRGKIATASCGGLVQYLRQYSTISLVIGALLEQL